MLFAPPVSRAAVRCGTKAVQEGNWERSGQISGRGQESSLVGRQTMWPEYWPAPACPHLSGAHRKSGLQDGFSEEGQGSSPCGQHAGQGVARTLLRPGAMTEVKSLIAVRHLSRDGRRIPVLLFRNVGGSVAGQCMLDQDDTPIVDAPTASAVISLLERVIDDLIAARRRTADAEISAAPEIARVAV